MDEKRLTPQAILTAAGEPATCETCQLQFKGVCTARPPLAKGWPTCHKDAVCTYWRERPSRD